MKLTLKDKTKAEERVEGLLKRIDKLKHERDELNQVLRQAMEVVEQRRQAETKAKAGLLRQRKKNQSDDEFVSSCVQAIEMRVKELNQELEASAGSVTQERQILKEMQRVRATKQQIPLYLQRSKAAQEARAQCKRAERDVEAKESFIKTLEEELKELRAEIAALDGKEAVEQKPVKEALTSEEQVLMDQLNGLYAQLRTTKDGLNENREKWYEARREKARKTQEKAHAKQEEERARREAERKKASLDERNEKKAEVPHAKEIRDCAALLAYLDGLLVVPVAASTAPTTGVAPSTVVVQRGPKIADDDWGNFAAGNKKGKKTASAAKIHDTKKAKFVINLQSMEQFAKLGFAPPMSLEQVPAVREQVAAKHAELVTKSELQRAQTLAKIAEEEAAEAKAALSADQK